ncbi:MAG: histidine phosphotransferase family protein [Alphaproteobacteria bacterium]
MDTADQTTVYKDQLHLLNRMLLFSQLASSHIAHDLASPIGAIMTGLEILEFPKNASEDDKEILGLLQKSSELLRSRLDFFRAAYAIGGQTLGVRYVRPICQNYFKLQERVELTWTDHFDQVKFAKGTLQLFINVLMWLHNKVPKRGELVVTMNPETHTLEATLKSSIIVLGGDDEAILSGKLHLEEVTAQSTQTYMIFLLSTVLDYPVTLESYGIDEICVRIQSKSP